MRLSNYTLWDRIKYHFKREKRELPKSKLGKRLLRNIHREAVRKARSIQNRGRGAALR